MELGQVALECFETKKIASAILLTRAAMETCAALCYLSGKLETTIQSKSVGDIDDYLMKLLIGSKIDLDILPPAISVMAFLDKVDKEGHFRRMYECLCEYAHPNYRGTGFLYSKNDEANLWTDFGANIRGEENSMKIGLNSLSLALMLFEDKYDRIGESMPAFVTLCKTVTGDSKSS